MSWALLPGFLQSAAIAGAILTAALAAVGYPMKIWIQSSVTHRFSRKLEEIRNDLSRNNSRLDALQTSTLSLMSARQTAIDARCLKGIEALWSATVDQQRFKSAVRILQRLNVPAIAKGMKEGGPDREKMKEFGAALFSLSGLENAAPADGRGQSPDYERLFVPPPAWTAFEALRSTNMHALAILTSMKAGVGPSLVVDIADVNRLIQLALPHMSGFLADHPDSGAYLVTDSLENAIFDHLAGALEFPDSDRKNIEKARSIASSIENRNVAVLDAIPDRYKRAEILSPP